MSIYLAIDLKSFYASVECVQRGLDPLDTALVVADDRRGDKTICLAVTPPLKAMGISGRPRLFEVKQQMKHFNQTRLNPSSISFKQIQKRPERKLDLMIARPQMGKYIEVSTQIYQIYLRYFSCEDIVVYSIDEVFIDLTGYLNLYQKSPRALTTEILKNIKQETGITATAGIGTNLYLAKVAMDIEAKHQQDDESGVRIAYLDEVNYRQTLWNHQPITDFWRVGRGYAKRLAKWQMTTMKDIAQCSLEQPDLLFKLFGKNAQFLIDHAWGYEPCTMKEIKAYRPANHSVGSGQVLHDSYSKAKARIVVKEMCDQLALDLVSRKLETEQLVLTIGYEPTDLPNYELVKDYYGRWIPKHAHGTAHLQRACASSHLFRQAIDALYERIVDEHLKIKRIHLSAIQVQPEGQPKTRQLDLWTQLDQVEQEENQLKKEKQLQQSILTIKGKYGKNALLKGMSLEEGATSKQRNEQIGGHQA